MSPHSTSTWNDCFLSIVITTYNSASFVKHIVDNISLLLLPVQYEIIFVDDASKDNTYLLLSDYVSTQIFTRLISTDKNGGPALARNLGLDHAIGDYIFFWDSDDLLDPSIFVALYSALSRFPDCDAVFCDSKWINSLGSNLRADKYSYTSDSFFCQSDLLEIVRDRFSRLSSKGLLDCKGRLIKLSTLRSFSVRFDCGLRYLEDEVFLWDLFSVSNLILYVRSQLYSYNINEDVKTGVIDGLLLGFGINSLKRISSHAENLFTNLGCSLNDSRIMSSQVSTYFILNVLISCAKSCLQGKILRQTANQFILSFCSDVLASPSLRRSIICYKRCKGESKLLYFALCLSWDKLILFAAFRRARKIVG